MKDFHRILEEKKVLVSDGAWGTEMIKLGLSAGETPELWNLEKPSLVKKVAEKYREAGADIILTNTFGANRLKMERAGLNENVKDINRAGVELSKEEAGNALVFASIGPTGEFLEPLGDFKEENFVKAFSEQVEGFVEGKADGVMIETMSDVKEALCALKAVRQNSSLPAGVSFSFNKKGEDFVTIMGGNVRQVILSVMEQAPDIIGANCGSVTIEDMSALAKITREITSIPLWIKANAGIPYIKDGQTFYPQKPEEMAEFAAELIKEGAKLIGGCCGTTPEHIKLIRKKVDLWRKEE